LSFRDRCNPFGSGKIKVMTANLALMKRATSLSVLTARVEFRRRFHAG
jgi:hypothetical protein